MLGCPHTPFEGHYVCYDMSSTRVRFIKPPLRCPKGKKDKSSLKLQVQSYKRLLNVHNKSPLSTRPTDNQLLGTRACWLLSSEKAVQASWSGRLIKQDKSHHRRLRN